MKEFLMIFTPAIIAVLTTLATYTARRLVLLINEKTNKEQRDLILDIVKGAVMFVEQITKKDIAMVGEAKFELAKETILVLLQQEGLEITDVDLEVLIERFVLELKGVE